MKQVPSNGISHKGFTLASGHVSPFYVDCRALMAHPSARRLVGQLAHGALMGVEIDCLGGLEIGAISIATTISDFAYAADPKREWRTFVVRKQAKDHGLGKLIEGAIRSRGPRLDRGRCPDERRFACSKLLRQRERQDLR